MDNDSCKHSLSSLYQDIILSKTDNQKPKIRGNSQQTTKVDILCTTTLLAQIHLQGTNSFPVID